MNTNWTYSATNYGEFCGSFRKWPPKLKVNADALVRVGKMDVLEAQSVLNALSKLQKSLYVWHKQKDKGHMVELNTNFCKCLKLAGIINGNLKGFSSKYYDRMYDVLRGKNGKREEKCAKYFSIVAGSIITEIRKAEVKRNKESEYDKPTEKSPKQSKQSIGEQLSNSIKAPNETMTGTQLGDDTLNETSKQGIEIPNMGKFCIALVENDSVSFTKTAMNKFGLDNVQASNLLLTAKQIYLYLHDFSMYLPYSLNFDKSGNNFDELKNTLEGWFKWAGIKPRRDPNHRRGTNDPFFKVKTIDYIALYGAAVIARKQSNTYEQLFRAFAEILCIITGNLLVCGKFEIANLMDDFYESPFIHKTRNVGRVLFTPGATNYNYASVQELEGAKKPIYLYYASPNCNKKHFKEIQCVNYLCECFKSPYTCVISGLWCPICDKYYILYESYARYVQELELVPIRLLRDPSMTYCHERDAELHIAFEDDGDTYEWYSNLNKHSKLAELGYSTTFSDEYRRHLLAYIIDKKLMSKAEIVDWLSFLIRTRKHRHQETEKRKRDLAFVDSYDMTLQRGPIPGIIQRK